MSQGFVYILVSPNSEFIKIGRTDNPPIVRIRQINSSENYMPHGPWELSDFRHVHDCQAIEAFMHNRFATERCLDIDGTRELFRLSPVEARRELERLDTENPTALVKHEPIDRMFLDNDFALYIEKLFAFTGLPNWLDIQGAWTFSLFPSTSGGRYFTLNIDRHEVAFTTRPRSEDSIPRHSFVLDPLIMKYPKVERWLKDHQGGFYQTPYASALPESVCVQFSASLSEAEKFFRLEGVRRAAIAYWTESLLIMQERGNISLHAKHHNYNAVAMIAKRIRHSRGMAFQRPIML